MTYYIFTLFILIFFPVVQIRDRNQRLRFYICGFAVYLIEYVADFLKERRMKHYKKEGQK